MESRFFKDMLSLPHLIGGDVVDGLPVIQLSEDAETLNYIIPMLYPSKPVIPFSESKVLSLLATCQKYDMVLIQSSIRAEAHRQSSRNLSGTAPFCTYAIASSKGLTLEMENAARLTLDHSMTFEALGEGLRLFEGCALRNLVRFRKRCKDNVVACLESFLDARAGPSRIWVGCPSTLDAEAPVLPSTGPSTGPRGPTRRSTAGGTSRNIPALADDPPSLPLEATLPTPEPVKNVLPRWLCEFLTRIRDKTHAFTEPVANPASIRKDYLAALKAHAGCYFCLRVHATEGHDYCEELESKLLEARNKVNSPRVSSFSPMPNERLISPFVSVR
jgi:hypothetical protein